VDYPLHSYPTPQLGPKPIIVLACDQQAPV